MIEDNGITNVVFNISKLSFIDAEGMNNLLKNFEICRKNHGNALLCGANRKMRVIFLDKQNLENSMIEDELSAFGKIII